MKISKKIIVAAALAATITTSSLVAPPAYAAVVVNGIVVDVNGVKVSVDPEEYGLIALGLGDAQLDAYLKAGNATPKVYALNVGGKYVDVGVYGENLLFSSSAEEALANTPASSSDGFKEVTGFDQNGQPIFKEVSPVIPGESYFSVKNIE